MKDITRLLQRWSSGDQAALDQLMPIVYGELHKLAGHYLRRENKAETLQSTALVNEAYLRLVKQHSAEWESRFQFYGVAAQNPVLSRISPEIAQVLNRANFGLPVNFVDAQNAGWLLAADAGRTMQMGLRVQF